MQTRNVFAIESGIIKTSKENYMELGRAADDKHVQHSLMSVRIEVYHTQRMVRVGQKIRMSKMSWWGEREIATKTMCCFERLSSHIKASLLGLRLLHFNPSTLRIPKIDRQKSVWLF